jgi:peptide/nickel transport system permease protein
MTASYTAGSIEPEPLPADAPVQLVSRTPWQLARLRLREDRAAMIAGGFTVFFVLLAILAPVLDSIGVLNPTDGHPELVMGPGSTPTGAFGGWSIHHLLGVVPMTGWDVLSRIVLGFSIDLGIAFTATVITVVIGLAVGVYAGYRGGAGDWVLGRLMDLVLAFPQLLMLIALSPVLEQRVEALGVPSGNPTRATYMVLVLAAFGWPYLARVVRGQTLSLRAREFTEAARLLGASPWRVMRKEILPNLWATILVYSTLILPTYVGAEAAMSYLGVGIITPTPSLGNILQDSVNYATTDPVYFLAPGVVLIAMILSFNRLGDGLRDALDPRAGR